MSRALAAIVAASFTVAFVVSLVLPAHDERPRTAVRQTPVGAPSSPVVSDPARLRSVAALPALRVPRATPTPAAPTLVVAPEPPPVTASSDAPAPPSAAPAPPSAAPAPPSAAPAPVAPKPAPPPPEPSPEPSEQGPIFDSSG